MKDKDARSFAIKPDKDTLRQFKSCYREKFVVKAALMPDAHKGYVAPIGSVLVTKDYVVPSWVGYDIGCGVSAAKIKNKGVLKLIKENKDKIYEEVRKNVPMGLGNISEKSDLSEKSKKKFEKIVKKFKNKEYSKDVLNFIENGKARLHLGSLGHGNHFIEIAFDEKGYAWIVVHCGSRGVGHKIAGIYMKKSANKKEDFEKTYPLEKNSKLGKEYLNVLDFGLEFALINRMEIIERVIGSIEKVLGKKVSWNLWVNKNHNHAILEKGLFIHRKGATPAKKGERGVIPGNMKDGSYLVEGKGNKEFLESTSHGAGRKYGRKDARKRFNMKDFKELMKGIKATVDERVLDEIPLAYKDIDEVMEAQKKSAKIVSHLKPLINWKG